MTNSPYQPQIAPPSGTVWCDNCGQVHRATFSHMSREYGVGGSPSEPVYAVVCPTDWLTDYYLTERVTFE